ncbi:MAG: HPr kinase/phosphorylase [Maricaulaceae bacterium]
MIARGGAFALGRESGDPIGGLIRGPSGSGKSDLLLRLITDERCTLVSDDYAVLSARSGVLHASPPAEIAGLIEARGVGVVRQPFLQTVRIVAVFDVSPPADPPLRCPPPKTIDLLGVALRAFRVRPFEASAAAKVRLTLEAVADGLFADAANRLDTRLDTRD